VNRFLGLKSTGLRLALIILSSQVCSSLQGQFFLNWFKPKGAPAPRMDIYHVAPPHWYIGFDEPELQIILHAENADLFEIQMQDYSGVEFVSKVNSANRHVCYINLKLSKNALPGTLTFTATPISSTQRYAKPFSFKYELKARASALPPKITSQDVTYLIFPDRFANGDESNDNADVQFHEKVNRKELKYRHGGDIQGITEKLDYLQELGATTLWLNPVQTNDQDKESFHGYAMTDHYEIDPRLGGNTAYLNLSSELQKRKMKLVMDIVPNHVGNNHWMYQFYDTGWFNFRDTFLQTNFRANTAMDPYASSSEKLINTDGAFVMTMPDLNQKNPQMAKYLDQMYLWWVEYARLSGYRVDTYPYVDAAYMNHLCELLEKYYPGFVIYGETWVEQTATQVAFTQNNIKGFEQNKLPGVTDFVLCWAMQSAGNKNYGWLEGLNKVYQILGEDYLYEDPNKNLTFLDNHDLSRIYSVVNQDFNAWKRVQMLLFTLRGMPGIYYGTEILMAGTTEKSDAYVRFDFPGGWKSDPVNKFKSTGRTSQENEAFNYIKTLARYRNSNPVFLNGKTTQFAGKDDTYCYFRYNDKSTIFCVYNQKKDENRVDMRRFKERTQGFTKMKNILTGEIIEIPKYSLDLAPEASYLFELIK